LRVAGANHWQNKEAHLLPAERRSAWIQADLYLMPHPAAMFEANS
jgi:hypothetical protein